MQDTDIDIDIAREDDAADFVRLLETIDGETENMLYEPGERTLSVDLQRKALASDFATVRRLVLLAKDGSEAVGYLGIMAGGPRRIRHIASLAIGVRRSHWGRGIGTALMSQAIELARANGITRLELKVRTNNTRAVRLYRAAGFRQEGVRTRSLRISGNYHDEYYMGLELGD